MHTTYPVLVQPEHDMKPCGTVNQYKDCFIKKRLFPYCKNSC